MREGGIRREARGGSRKAEANATASQGTPLLCRSAGPVQADLSMCVGASRDANTTDSRSFFCVNPYQ